MDRPVLGSGGYNEQRDPWYSPHIVIDKFRELASIFGEDNILKPDFKNAKEMFTAAVGLLGAYELGRTETSSQNIYFLQLNKQSKSPDVMAAKQTERPNDPILLEMSQMEVTELEDHFKSDNVVEFLKETKLSPKKSYSDKTMIVCLVNRKVPLNPHQIQEALKILKPRPTIYIIGRTDQNNAGDYLILTAYPPTLSKPVHYNLVKTAKKYSLPSRVRFGLGMDYKINYKKENMEPFDIYDMFGLDELKLKTKYKIVENKR